MVPTAVPVLIVLPLFLFTPPPLPLAILFPLTVRFPVIPVPADAILLPLAVRNVPPLFIPGPVVPGNIQHFPRHPAPLDHSPRPVVRPRTVPPLTARRPPEPPVEEPADAGVRDEVDLGLRDHHDFRRLGHHDRRRPEVDADAHLRPRGLRKPPCGGDHCSRQQAPPYPSRISHLGSPFMPGEVIVGEFAPLLFDPPFDFIPLSFQNIFIHVRLLLSYSLKQGRPAKIHLPMRNSERDPRIPKARNSQRTTAITITMFRMLFILASIGRWVLTHHRSTHTTTKNT